MERAVSENGLQVPLLKGTQEERRRQGMAWVHRQLGGQCAKCHKPSDLVTYFDRDPTFKRWNRSCTNFDVHHPDSKSEGKPLFRLGQLYVRTAKHPNVQKEKLLEALNLLKGCILLCQTCHTQHHREHGGRTFSRGVPQL
jgi:hypothetical protein